MYGTHIENKLIFWDEIKAELILIWRKKKNSHGNNSKGKHGHADKINNIHLFGVYCAIPIDKLADFFDRFWWNIITAKTMC